MKRSFFMSFWIVFNLVQFEFLKNLDFKKFHAANFDTPWGCRFVFWENVKILYVRTWDFWKRFLPLGDMLQFLIPPGVKKMTFWETLKLCPYWQGDFHFWQVFEVCRNFEVFKTYRIVVKIDTILIGVYFRNCFENWNSLTLQSLLRERVTLAQFDRKRLLFLQAYTL